VEHVPDISDKDDRNLWPKVLAVLVTVALIAGIAIYIVHGSAI
jgi:hypothetical protein